MPNAVRIRFGHNDAPRLCGHNGCIEQFHQRRYFRTRIRKHGPAPCPDHGPLGSDDPLDGQCEFCVSRGLRGNCGYYYRWHSNQLRLEIDWYLNADGTWWRRHGFGDGSSKHGRRLFRTAHAMSFFADALKHPELIFAVMNVASAGIDESRCDVPGDMQQGRSTVP